MIHDTKTPACCFLADYFKISRPKKDDGRRVTEASIITTAMIAGRYFHGNLVFALTYMQHHHRIRKLDKSNFNRHLHRLSALVSSVFFARVKA